MSKRTDNSVPPHFIQVVGGQGIRLTAEGRRAYAERFALAGIAIDGIRTRSALRAALRASQGAFLSLLQAGVQKMNGSAEAKALIADILGGQYRLSAEDTALIKAKAAADREPASEE
jgi:hypothetical protein